VREGDKAIELKESSRKHGDEGKGEFEVELRRRSGDKTDGRILRLTDLLKLSGSKELEK
jgi:hypothetical protein